MKKMVYTGFEYNNRTVYFIEILADGFSKEYTARLYIAPGIHFIIYLDKQELEQLKSEIENNVYTDYDLFRHDWLKVNDPVFYKILFK